MPKVSHKVKRIYYFIIFFESTLRSPTKTLLSPRHYQTWQQFLLGQKNHSNAAQHSLTARQRERGMNVAHCCEERERHECGALHCKTEFSSAEGTATERASSICTPRHLQGCLVLKCKTSASMRSSLKSMSAESLRLAQQKELLDPMRASCWVSDQH